LLVVRGGRSGAAPEPGCYESRTVDLTSESERDTESLGERLARHLRPGDVIGLVGPLGAGKTALVRGVARGLGVEEGLVHSPTFVSATEYPGRVPLAHVDLYRHEESLPHPDWLAEMLDGERVAMVEWFERLGADAPDDVLRVEIAYGAGDTGRRLALRPTGRRSGEVVAALAACEVAA
jgi:tRNA threonylcarbamoyladenosine biosynthesis protein TsaE